MVIFQHLKLTSKLTVQITLEYFLKLETKPLSFSLLENTKKCIPIVFLWEENKVQIQSSMGKTHNLRTARLTTPLEVLTVTTRTMPS